MLSSKPWRFDIVLLFASGVFACMCLGAIAIAVLRRLGMTGFETADSLGSVLVATLSFQGAACAGMIFFLQLHGAGIRESLGLRNPKLGRSLLLGGLTAAMALPLVLVLQQCSEIGLRSLGWAPKAQRAVNLFVQTDSPGMLGYLIFFTLCLAPVAEEFIFRGVLFPFVKQLGWPRMAWVGVSLLFALIHVNLPTFVPLFALALVLTWIYDQTDCLLASILAHSLFNAVNLVILFLQNR